MAFEHRATPPWTRAAASTGMKPRRFCTIDSNGRAANPANGAAVVGVRLTGSTGSTVDFQAVSILSYGIARVEAKGGVLTRGSQCKATSVGLASSLSAGDYAVGIVAEGTSGTTGRVLSVLLLPIGTT